MTETATGLPEWAGMSDLDKGAALLHLHKRDREGPEYAVENYPARYFDHPALTALSPREACRHAVSVEDDAEQAGALRGAEYERLYGRALDADHARWEAERKARAGELVSTTETTQEAVTGVSEAAVDAAHAAATEFARRWGDPVPPRGMIRRMLGASARMWSTQELVIDRMRSIIRNVDAWLDEEVSAGYQGQPLAQDWARVCKVAEETGEAIEALIACTGQNPRKGHCGTLDDLLDELADVAVTGMFGIQHFTKNEQQTFAVVMAALEKAAKRAAEAGYGC